MNIEEQFEQICDVFEEWDETESKKHGNVVSRGYRIDNDNVITVDLVEDGSGFNIVEYKSDVIDILWAIDIALSYRNYDFVYAAYKVLEDEVTKLVARCRQRD